MRHFGVSIQDVAEAAILAGKTHHQPQFDDESGHRHDGQQLVLGPVDWQIVDKDLGRWERDPRLTPLSIFAPIPTHLAIF